MKPEDLLGKIVWYESKDGPDYAVVHLVFEDPEEGTCATGFYSYDLNEAIRVFKLITKFMEPRVVTATDYSVLFDVLVNKFRAKIGDFWMNYGFMPLSRLHVVERR